MATGTDSLSAFAWGFARSRRGNLWRKRRDLTLTVFAYPNKGGYGWCIAGAGRSREWSQGDFASEEVAMADLYERLQSGERLF
jgi:hypothetical protein